LAPGANVRNSVPSRLIVNKPPPRCSALPDCRSPTQNTTRSSFTQANPTISPSAPEATVPGFIVSRSMNPNALRPLLGTMAARNFPDGDSRTCV